MYCLSLWQGICDDSECVLHSRACFTKRISHAYNQCDFKYDISAQYNVNEDSLQWCDYYYFYITATTVVDCVVLRAYATCSTIQYAMLPNLKA